MPDSELNIEAVLAEKAQQLKQRGGKADSLDHTYWNLATEVSRLEGQVLHLLLPSCMLPPKAVVLLPFKLPFVPPQCIPRPPRAETAPDYMHAHEQSTCSASVTV